MSSSSKGTFATPGSRSFATPCLPSCSFKETPATNLQGNSKNVSTEERCNRETPTRAFASVEERNMGKNRSAGSLREQTPLHSSNLLKRSLLNSSGYASKKRSVIYTSPDPQQIELRKEKMPLGNHQQQNCIPEPETMSGPQETPVQVPRKTADPRQRTDRSSDLSSYNINNVSNESASSSMIIQRNFSGAETSNQSSPMSVQRTFRGAETSNELSNTSRIVERNFQRAGQTSNKSSAGSMSVQRNFSRAETSTRSCPRESGDQTARADADLNFRREIGSDNSMIVNQISGNRTGVSSGNDGDIKTYMCAVKSAGKIAVAYYDTDNCQIRMMEDVAETQDYHFLQLMKRRIQPDVIITSAKQEESFLQALRDDEESSNLERHVQIEIIPCMMFGYDICKRRILTLNGLPGLPEESSELERNIYFGSLLSFDNINMVRAAGALLKYLDKNRVGVELEDPGTRVPILALKSFSLNSVMMVDDSTYGALQIFSKEAHPSVYKSGGSGSKEGLSLFGIINYTKSIPGSRLLRQWFLHPLTNMDEIKERQDAISFFLLTRNLEAVMAFQDSLKNVKNVSRILSKMLSTGANITDWQNLYKAVYNAICIGDVCRSLPQDVEIIRKIAASFTEELYTMANLINKIVDFEESITHNRFVVKPGIDADLDERKRTYNGLPDLMTKVASEELKRLDDSITECGVSYLPQLGYLLAVPVTDRMKEEQNFDIDGLEFVFFSDDIVHYKTAGTRELDQLLGDTQSLIFDHETAIMYRLQGVILENTQLMLNIVDLAAELDCLLALTTAAREGNYCQPELTDDPIMRIKGGRHPIQELCTTQFVANDFDIEIEKGRIKVITGPNASGKSIYLKQVGLVVFLAQIGSFVPAEEALIGISDRLFTRIHAKETVSTPLSTFMIDLNQISAAVHGATEKSLILVDEFGKGTSSTDGLSLLAAVLVHWVSEGSHCPRVLVSTHFHGLIKYKLLPESDLVHYQTMEVMEDDGDLVFLYHLKDGHADCSYALNVAKVAGVDDHIIQRGEEVSKLIASNREVERLSSGDAETRYERFSAITEKFLQLNLDECDVLSFLEGCVHLVNEP